MNDYDDPVDAVILAFLDYLEGVAPRPTLDHLSGPDQARASAYLDGMVVARGLDHTGGRPSVEALLPAIPAIGVAEADLATVRTLLAGVDPRARVSIDGSAVLVSYLDLRARFVLVPGVAPVVTDGVRTVLARLLSDDPDTSQLGVVAAHSEELTTQLLRADELGAATITTPRGEPHLGWDRPLPLALAARRMLEQSAPEWPAFDFDSARVEALDVTSLAAEIARRVIARESARSYQGDKRRAYLALLGQENVFADLVARVAGPGPGLDLAAEIARVAA